jgi:DNA-binding GntR family transcriptional regulator
MRSSTTRGETAPSGVARKSRLADEVYDTLLGRLMSHRMPPGARVNIDALARELGVSQTPIRDALSRLEADGLLVRTHLAGYRVAPKLTREQFEQLVEFRLLVEPTAARLAAERMSPEQLAELPRLAATMTNPTQGDRHQAYAIFAQQDAAFHALIAAGSGNRIIHDSLARLHIHVHLFRLLFDARVTTEAIDEHAEVLEAIVKRDPGAAAFAMRRHLLRSADRFRQIYD